MRLYSEWRRCSRDRHRRMRALIVAAGLALAILAALELAGAFDPFWGWGSAW